MDKGEAASVFGSIASSVEAAVEAGDQPEAVLRLQTFERRVQEDAPPEMWADLFGIAMQLKVMVSARWPELQRELFPD